MNIAGSENPCITDEHRTSFMKKLQEFIDNSGPGTIFSALKKKKYIDLLLNLRENEVGNSKSLTYEHWNAAKRYALLQIVDCQELTLISAINEEVKPVVAVSEDFFDIISDAHTFVGHKSVTPTYKKLCKSFACISPKSSQDILRELYSLYIEAKSEANFSKDCAVNSKSIL